MYEFFPLVILGAVLGVFCLGFIVTYALFQRRNKQDLDRQMKDSQIVKRLMVYAKPYWGQFLLALGIMLISIVYDLVSPLIVGRIEKTVAGEFALEQLFSLVGVYGGLLVVSMAGTYLQAMILQKAGQKILSSLRLDLFAHIQKLSHSQLNQIPVGRLVTRVTNDTNAISYLFTNILVTLVKNTMVIAGVVAAMCMLNYMLTLTVLCFVPVLVLFTVVFRRLSRFAHKQVSDATTEVNTFLSENLSGMRLIQFFNQQENKMAAFESHSRQLQKAKFGRMFVFGVFRPMVQMLNIAAILCLLYLGARGHIRKIDYFGQTIDGAVVVSFYMYISKFFHPIQSLAEQFDMLQKSFASAEKIFTVMDMAPQLTDEEDAVELKELKGEIEFEDVWFAYKPGTWVLKGVSFRVEPGQTVAFVGATGSGKTTILSLLCRNYDIQKGRILVDGVDIRKYRVGSLRRHFGQMLQDVFLFAGTVRSNILLGAEENEEELLSSIAYVNADSFINKLPQGLDEPVRERGNNFSAGQRQLLSFARCVYHRPSVMILDEATANIDTETEVLIQDSLEKMRNIGTMLVVAHRLSTIQHADNIIVLSEGQILEQGDHQTLLSRKGRYHQLYTLQYEKQQLESE